MRSLVATGAVLLALCPTSATSQDLDNRSGEAYDQVWFVPRLAGSVSLEGGILQPLALGNTSGYPTTWFAGLGWKHYLEGHGRAQIRLMATYEHGGLLSPSLEGTANRIGASAAFTLRGISQQWLFGQLSLTADVALLTLRPPAAPFGGERLEAQSGLEFGTGLESTFGSMFLLDPYLMAETGASATVARVTVGGVDAWEIWARWIVRFDVGVRKSDDTGTYLRPTVSSP